MMDIINCGGMVVSLCMLVWIIMDRQLSENRRKQEEEIKERIHQEKSTQRYEAIQKRVYNLEISTKAILECMFEGKDPMEVRKEVIRLLYQNPAWRTGEPLEKYLFKFGWRGYSRWQK